jgi:Ca2+-binding RTX toxin-like protein
MVPRRIISFISTSLIAVALPIAPAAAAVRCGGERVTVVGTHGDDRIRGTRGRDVIHGLSGDDVIVGRRGGDVICGGAGDDRIWGNKGHDRIFGGSGDDAIRAGKGRDLVRAGKGSDVIFGGMHDDAVYGGRGVDRISGAAGDDFIDLGPGSFEGSAQIAGGGPGNDEIYGSSAHEDIYGGSGDDLIVGREGTVTDVVARGGIDNLRGQKGNDHIISGTAGAPSLGPRVSRSFGGSGNDLLEDLDGGATLFGGPGHDHFEGPAQDRCCSTLDFSDSPAGVVVDLSMGTAHGEGNDTIEGHIPWVNGSLQDDVLMGDGGDNRLFGDDGNDDLGGAGGNDTLIGSTGDDLLDGGEGRDEAVFSANELDEPLVVNLDQGFATGQGRDSIVAVEDLWVGANRSAGAEVIGDDAPNNIESHLLESVDIQGRGGDDRIRTLSSGRVEGGAGNDRITSLRTRGASDIFGEEGDDTLLIQESCCTDAAQTVDGGTGMDHVMFFTPPIRVDLASGIGTYHQEDPGTVRFLLSGVEAVTGSERDDVLLGDSGANMLDGREGNDRIEGRAGDDFLDGGPGDSDYLDGGDGVDECVNGETVTNCES